MYLLFASFLLCLLGVSQGTSLFSPAILIGTAQHLAPVLNGYLLAFILLATWRYLRLIVHLVANWTFQPIIPRQNPWFRSRDVTVVVITVDGESPVFSRCIDSIIANNPFKVLIVTPISNKSKLQTKFEGNGMVTVLGAQRTNQRYQQVVGLSCVRTPMVVLADDDVIWPSTFLWTALAAFEDPAVGAAATCQRIVRDHAPSLWDFLGAVYLERRNFECAATARITGHVSTLSGRTQIIRSEIVCNDGFKEGYLAEKWLGRIPVVNADGDKFVTRWVKRRGWKMAYQYCPEAELRTTLNDNWSFLQSCVRWYRTIWRGAVNSIFVERSIWRGQPWMDYANLSRILNPAAVIMDPTLGFLLYKAVKVYSPESTGLALLLFAFWLMFTKTIKLVPHFWRYPADIKFLPCHFLFGYLHGLLKIYALITITQTGWLGRVTIDEDGPSHTKAVAPVGGIPDDIAVPGVRNVTIGGAHEDSQCQCHEHGAWIKNRREVSAVTTC